MGVSSDYLDRFARNGIQLSNKLTDAGVGATILGGFFNGNVQDPFRALP